jgi:prolyl oligopeptidase
MLKWLPCAILICVTLFSYSQIQYPTTKKVDQQDNYHGVIVNDPYRWLENDTSEDTRKWVGEQNAVTFRYLSAIPARDSFKNRLAELFNYSRYSVPFHNNGYYYFYKNDGLQNQAVLYRQRGLDGKAEVVVDPNTLSSDATTQLHDFEPSKNGKYAAYSLSRAGSDWQTVFVKEMNTMKDLSDSLQWVKISQIAWQGNGFYYSRYPQPAQGQELSSRNENHTVWYHLAGTSQKADKLVYTDTVNVQRFNRAQTSEDGRYLFIIVQDRGKGLRGNALYYRDNRNADTTFIPIVKDVTDFTYLPIEVTGNKMLIYSNADAKNGKVVSFDPRLKSAQWKTVLPESDEPLQDASFAGGKLFARYLADVTTKVFVYSTAGKKEKEIALPGPGTAAGFSGHSTDRYTFYSFNTYNVPTRIYKYEIATGKSTVFRKPETKFDADEYETKREFYKSKDGTRIPIFIVAKKGLKLNGKNPAMLYGYGGFNVSLNPFFSASLIPWLEQGGIFAVANLRGGSEYGENWHEAGMHEKKQNVFDDFIAAAEFLIEKKFTSPRYLAIRGGSNGGLLVGAVMNQRPDLFKVAIPEVGVMDMLRFQKFTIGWNWIAEYGTSDSASQFRYLYAYSPLHNMKANLDYPATLVTTSDHDDRVVPAHSFKYIATLQELYKGRNPVLIRIETRAGHGMSNMMKSIELAADIYAFAFHNMGLQWKNPRKL